MAPLLTVNTCAPVMAKASSSGVIAPVAGVNGPTARGRSGWSTRSRSYSSRPSTNTRSTRSAVRSRKCPSSSTRSASFPTSMLPTRWASIIARAPLMVITSSACSSVRPWRARNAPYSRKSLKCWFDMSVWMLACTPASSRSFSRFRGLGSPQYWTIIIGPITGTMLVPARSSVSGKISSACARARRSKKPYLRARRSTIITSLG